MNGATEHLLLECRGCETVFYQKASWDSENTDHVYNRHTGEHDEVFDKTISTFPRPDTKTKPAWIDGMFFHDPQLSRILDEMYVALDNESHILTAVGLRTALDRATEVLGISAAQPFAAKLDALLSGGWIGATEREVLGVVTDAGNAAAHRGWSPDAKEIRLLVSSFEVFLQRAFVVGKRALSIKTKIPPKPKKTS